MSDVVAALRDAGAAVVIAPPGAGKTTRVPAALLDAGIVDGDGGGEIVVLQPRRLAARMAARRVAAERGERVGGAIGYEVRFERRVSAATRIRFVTEGVLLRRAVAEPTLPGVGAVIIDELHERHLTGDVALALVQRLRQTRPALRVAAMSATLDPGPVAAFLGGCPVVDSRGRQHPVAVQYADHPREWPLAKRVAAAVAQATASRAPSNSDDGGDSDGGGDVLVFLPGAAEIRRAMAACAELAQRRRLLCVPLHGDLPADEQDRALAPVASPYARKVIFSTNVAETSLTIEGVTWVIDSGLARAARHAPWSGIPRLVDAPISRASAAQRAGRAGRTAPGHCIRLYGEHDHGRRPAFEVPEVLRADLAEVALDLYAMGAGSARGFPWLEPPPDAAVDAAEELLARLGAIAGPPGARAITELGRDMARLPVHPRQARVLIEAQARGYGAAGCVLAAAIGNRDLRRARRGFVHNVDRGVGHGAVDGVRQADTVGPSDLIDQLDWFEAARAAGLRADRIRGAGLDPAAVMAVERTRRQLARIAGVASGDRAGRDAAEAGIDLAARDRALQIATLAGYPDRVARRRAPGSCDLALAGGGRATLSAASAVSEAALVCCVDAGERGNSRGVIVHQASAVEPDWLLDLYIDRIDERDELAWNPVSERVERVAQLVYDGLVIHEQRESCAAQGDAQADTVARILADAALAAGVDRCVDRFLPARDRTKLVQLRLRLAFVADARPDAGIRPPTDADVADAVRAACVGLSSFAELSRVPLLSAIAAAAGPQARALVDRLAPTDVALPGRRRVPVTYEADRPPHIASRIQDFFGLARGPTVADGAVPLVLHLLAPNQRAVQVTSDLSGFWTRHYPDLRRQLMRRYPKHAWPEDPLAPLPPRSKR